MSSPLTEPLVEDQKPECCGTDACYHTLVQCGNHQGVLVDGGLMFCDDGRGELKPCRLKWSDSSTPCLQIEDLEGHVHSPGCGHEMVPHGDHVDFLVGNELQHVVVDICCPNKCVDVAKYSVVSHGFVNILRQRQVGMQGYVQIPVTSSGANLTTTRIVAEGICCPSEVPIIERALKPLPGVVKVEVSVVTKMVIVEHSAADVSPGVLVSALNGLNLGASLASSYMGNEDESGQGWKASIPPLQIVLCFLLLMISLLHYFGGTMYHFKWVALGAIGIGTWPILLKAYGAVRACYVDIHILMTLAVAGAIAIGEYTEGAAVVFLFGLADWLESKCTKHASNALAAILYLQPDKAFLLDPPREIEATQVQIGEVVVVRPGCKVPVDGMIVQGSTLIDQSMLTGESEFVNKGKGDTVMSGTLNTGVQAINVETTSLAVNSTASRIAELVEEACRKKAPSERFISSFAKYYTPSLITATILVICVPLALQVDNWNEWIHKGLVLLVCACPCALVLSTPVTVVCGLARAAQKGVVIKGAEYLEALGRCRIITFDKTGTLTRGQVQLTKVGVLNHSKTERQIVEVAAALESHSQHPLSHAILGYAVAKGYNSWSRAETCEEVSGEGLMGTVQGQQVFVGNQRMVNHLCRNPDIVSMRTTVKYERNGETVVFVGGGGVMWGFLTLKDLPRPEANAAVTKIKSYGVKVGMLTGDRKLVADHIAVGVAIDNQYVHAELFPQDKLDVVQSLKKSNKTVCHVGDGVNDGPALAASDVGVAMGIAGSAVAIETANIALFTSDLRQLAFAVRISRASVQTIYFNVVFSVIIKLAIIILAFTLGVSLWIAVLGDVGSCIAVILYSMTILQMGKREEREARKGKLDCQYQQSQREQANKNKRSQKMDDCKKGCCGTQSVTQPKDQEMDVCDGTQKFTKDQKLDACCGGGEEKPIDSLSSNWTQVQYPQVRDVCGDVGCSDIGCRDTTKVQYPQVRDVCGDVGCSDIGCRDTTKVQYPQVRDVCGDVRCSDIGCRDTTKTLKPRQKEASPQLGKSSSCYNFEHDRSCNVSQGQDTWASIWNSFTKDCSGCETTSGGCNDQMLTSIGQDDTPAYGSNCSSSCRQEQGDVKLNKDLFTGLKFQEAHGNKPSFGTGKDQTHAYVELDTMFKNVYSNQELFKGLKFQEAYGNKPSSSSRRKHGYNSSQQEDQFDNY